MLENFFSCLVVIFEELARISWRNSHSPLPPFCFTMLLCTDPRGNPRRLIPWQIPDNLLSLRYLHYWWTGSYTWIFWPSNSEHACIVIKSYLRLKVFWIVKISIFRAVSFIGLFLIAVGTGGIKPCVAPFGAEQFQLPEQEAKMKQYFSWFYASINLGATASTLLTPNLRNQECLDASSCFPLAFGVPAALMVVALSKYRNKKLVVLLPTDLG